MAKKKEKKKEEIKLYNCYILNNMKHCDFSTVLAPKRSVVYMT